MNYLLFAGARYYPAGGAHDLIGVFSELPDVKVFEAVMERVRSNRYDLDERIWVNAIAANPEAVSAQPNAVPAILNWEVRIEKSENHPSLKFCSYKENVDGFGTCGIIPLGRDNPDFSEVHPYDVMLYPLLDPEKRDINRLL